MGARARGVVVRIGVVVASVAAVLVPGWSNPARAITVPTTLARSVRLAAPGPGPHGLELAFAPTHIAFEWTGDGALEYRTGSRWRAVRADPDASSGDTHFSSAIAVDRPDALQWRSHGVTDVSVDYVNTIDGPRRTVMVPALAGAAPHAPDIVTRAEWGADESVKRTTGTCARVFYPVQQL